MMLRLLIYCSFPVLFFASVVAKFLCFGGFHLTCSRVVREAVSMMFFLALDWKWNLLISETLSLQCKAYVVDYTSSVEPVVLQDDC
jgi:hypothetical protein